MDRFEAPGPSSIIDLTPNTTDENDKDNEHIGLVWDRGPAGDFVYGNLNELSPAEKEKRYQEFIAFDQQVILPYLNTPFPLNTILYSPHIYFHFKSVVIMIFSSSSYSSSPTEIQLQRL